VEPDGVTGGFAADRELREPRHELQDVVQPALARALTLAAQAGRWELVAQIATELANRRSANAHIGEQLEGEAY